MSENLAPDPHGIVTEFRVMCSHEVHPVEGIPFELSVPQAIMQATDKLFADSSHLHGMLFNETTEEPFAVLSDFNGGVLVTWDFRPDETDFTTGMLSFQQGVTAIEWATITANALMNDLVAEAKMTGIQLIGFDESGPFSL